MEIVNLTPELIGKEISCIIERRKIDSAKIQFEDGYYYICQNEKNGTSCSDKLGYEHSWVVDRGSSRDLKNNGVVNIILLNQEPNYEIY